MAYGICKSLLVCLSSLLGSVSGSRTTNIRLWLSNSHGCWYGLLRILRLPNYTYKSRPSSRRNEITIIRLIDQLRLLDQDMIRLQEKVNTVLEMQENEKKLDSEQNPNKEV